MKKKVLFISTSLGGGGAEKVLVTMLRYFDYEKYDVSLLLTVREGVYLDEIPSQVKLLYIFECSSSLYAKIAFWLYARLRIGWLERFKIRRTIEQHYDTIISFVEGRAVKFHGDVLDRGTRNVSWVHTDMNNFHHSVGSGLSLSDEKYIYGKMSEIICVSQDARKQFLAVYPGFKNALTVIYNPLDKEEIIKKAEAGARYDSRFNFCSVGRLSPEKGVDRVIRVASRLKESGYKFAFHIIGEGEERPVLESMIKDACLEEVVQLHGFQKNPYPYIKNADCFVLPSRAEGFSLVCAEALILGAPVISCRCAGPCELLNEGKYGELVDQSEDALFVTCLRVLTNLEYRRELKNRSQCGGHSFDLEKIMQQVYSVI